MRKLQIAISALSLFVCAFVNTATAATINVNTTDDEFNEGGGDCSLREAIVSANRDEAIDGCTSGDGDDLINIPAGTYSVGDGACGQTSYYDEECDDLDIESNIVLQGSTSGETIIESTSYHRVLEIRSLEYFDVGTQAVPMESIVTSLNNVILQNGSDELGGCVFSNGSEVNITATFNDSTLRECFACIGGGLFSLLSDTTLNRSHVDENTGYFMAGGIASGAGLLLELLGTLPDNALTALSDEISALGEIFEIRGSLSVADNSTVNNNNGEFVTSEDKGSICDSIPPLFIAGGIASALVPLTVTDSEVNNNNEIDLTEILLSLEDVTGGLLVGGILRVDGDTEIRNSSVNSNNGLLAGGILSVAAGIAEIITNGDDDDDFGEIELDYFNIINSTVDGNNGWLTAGGIFNAGPMSVTSSTISNNRTVGGLGFSLGYPELDYILGGGGVLNLTSFTALNSTFSGNISEYGAGGAFLHSPLLSLVLPGGLQLGTSIVEEPEYEVAEAVFHNCTITGNITERGQTPEFPVPVAQLEVEPAIAAGGGLAVNFGNIVLRNTIVSGNQDLEACELLAPADDDDNEPFVCQVEEKIFAPDCYVAPCTDLDPMEGETFCEVFQGKIVSDGYNLVGNNAGCTFTAAATDKVGTEATPIDAKLGALADNGGPTLTHYPAVDSPALDMANPAAVVAFPESSELTTFECPDVDQRGFVRPQDSNLDGTAVCEIGSVEAKYDCAGTPEGTLVPDICGICGGNGSTGQTFNLEPAKLEMDGTGAAQLKTYNAAVNASNRTQKRACGGKGLSKKKIQQLKAAAAELYSGEEGIWLSQATIPGSYLQCNEQGATALCVESSTTTETDQILASSAEFANLLSALEKDLRKALKACGVSDIQGQIKRFRQRVNQNAKLNAQMQEAVAEVPTIVEQCAPAA